MSDPEQYDAIVIGGGKGGKTLAMYLGRRNHKDALIERDPMMIGGGCINVACIPTKTFIASARLVHSIRRAAEFGIKVEGVSVDWPAVKAAGRKGGVRDARLEPQKLHLSSEPRLHLGHRSFSRPARRRSGAERRRGPPPDLQTHIH